MTRRIYVNGTNSRWLFTFVPYHHSSNATEESLCARAPCSSAFRFSLLAFTALAHARHCMIDITRGNIEPRPVAVTDLTGGPRSASAATSASVVAADLERSGLFRPISQQAFLQQVSNGDAVPNFPDWRQINAQALVTGTVTATGGDKVRASFRLWDVLGGQQLIGKEYNTYGRNWRRVGHLIADEICWWCVSPARSGYFDTRIIYVAESGPDDQPRQAPRHHGPGRREPEIPDRRQSAGAHPALLAEYAADPFISSYRRACQPRVIPARPADKGREEIGRPLQRHELRAALQP